MSKPDRPSPPLSAALVGTWELLAREDRTAAGERRLEPALGSDPVALLFYDSAGNFAAQFMKRDRRPASEAAPDAARAGPNNSTARGGYDAYFGTYSVDDEGGTVTQLLTGALSPENVGLVLTREMTVTGDELVIRVETATVAGEPVVRTLTWHRLGA